jgi:iron(III) transport system substrate-binding protein
MSGPAAAQENRLTVYGSTQETGVRHITEAFTKDTGINVDWIRMSSGETLNRIRAEKSNPRASIWLCRRGTAHGRRERGASPAVPVPATHQDRVRVWTRSCGPACFSPALCLPTIRPFSRNVA